MNIKGETIQNGEPSPEHPVDIENKINLTGAIQILNKLKSKVTLVKVDDENNSEKEYRLPFLMNIEQQAIETVLQDYKKVLKENEELKNQEETARKINELLVQRYSNSIPVQKVKDNIKKYQKLSDEFYEKFLETNRTDKDLHDVGLACDAKVQVLQDLIESDLIEKVEG